MSRTTLYYWYHNNMYGMYFNISGPLLSTNTWFRVCSLTNPTVKFALKNTRAYTLHLCSLIDTSINSNTHEVTGAPKSQVPVTKSASKRRVSLVVVIFHNAHIHMPTSCSLTGRRSLRYVITFNVPDIHFGWCIGWLIGNYVGLIQVSTNYFCFLTSTNINQT